jgi:hypothetical protein
LCPLLALALPSRFFYQLIYLEQSTFLTYLWLAVKAKKTKEVKPNGFSEQTKNKTINNLFKIFSFVLIFPPFSHNELADLDNNQSPHTAIFVKKCKVLDNDINSKCRCLT